MKVGTGLLTQLERCGLSGKLAEEHAEIGADSSGARTTKIEIARAFHAYDHAQMPAAHAALSWVTTEPGAIVSIGEPLDLIDDVTGEVLATGRPGAVLRDPGLVVSWQVGDRYDAPEPDDDLGLIAMGLASPALKGQPFRTCYVILQDGEAFARKSEIFEPATHASLLERIHSVVSRPRIACPGDWCGGCRQNVHCESWKQRTRFALTVFERDTQIAGNEEPKDIAIPALEITNETAGPLALRIRAIKKACELADEQIKAFARNGGHVAANGKEYVAGSCDGRETADVSALKADGLTKYIRQGNPYETWRWRKSGGAAATKGKR